MTRLAALLPLPLLLAACATVPDSGQIVSEDQFRATVVGKAIRIEDGVVFNINGDNTISGDVNGETATGSWAFEDGYWCRTITLGEVFSEDCQLWVVEGDELIITRDRGQGESYRYRLSG